MDDQILKPKNEALTDWLPVALKWATTLVKCDRNVHDLYATGKNQLPFCRWQELAIFNDAEDTRYLPEGNAKILGVLPVISCAFLSKEWDEEVMNTSCIDMVMQYAEHHTVRQVPQSVQADISAVSKEIYHRGSDDGKEASKLREIDFNGEECLKYLRTLGQVGKVINLYSHLKYDRSTKYIPAENYWDEYQPNSQDLVAFKLYCRHHVEVVAEAQNHGVGDK